MKKKVIICMLITCTGILSSCNSTGKGKDGVTSTPKEEKDSVTLLNEELGVPDTISTGFFYYEKSKLRFFLSNFIKHNPNCFNNTIAMETYSEELKKQLDDAIKRDKTFIMDLAISYDELITQDATDNTTGKKVYIIGCKSGGYGEDGYYSNDKYQYTVYYTVVGGIPKEEMIKLKEDSDYMITGTIHTRKDEDYEGNKFGITYEYERRINLGCFFIKDLKLKEVVL